MLLRKACKYRIRRGILLSLPLEAAIQSQYANWRSIACYRGELPGNPVAGGPAGVVSPKASRG